MSRGRVAHLAPMVCAYGHLEFFHPGEPRLCPYWGQNHDPRLERCHQPVRPATEVELAAYHLGGKTAVTALKESP